MVSTNLSKDIEVEVIFSMPPDSGEKLLEPDDHSIYLIFDKEDLWKVQLWQEKNESNFAIGVPTRCFVEFESPQSLFGRLTSGKEFEIWRGVVVGKGAVLKLLNLEARAQENIENIVQRPREEVHQVLAFNKSLCGEPIIDDIDKIFYESLKGFLQMENIQNYLWLWKKPNRSHTFVEFDSPKLIPKISLLLPDKPMLIWFLVDIDFLLSAWFLYEADFAAVEKILEKYKFSQYYIVAKDFSWLIRKVNTKFIAIGNDVEMKLKQFQSMQNAA
jgi:hypothetical protein